MWDHLQPHTKQQDISLPPANESHGAVGSTLNLGPDLGFWLHLNNTYF